MSDYKGIHTYLVRDLENERYYLEVVNFDRVEIMSREELTREEFERLTKEGERNRQERGIIPTKGECR